MNAVKEKDSKAFVYVKKTLRISQMIGTERLYVQQSISNER